MSQTSANANPGRYYGQVSEGIVARSGQASYYTVAQVDCASDSGARYSSQQGHYHSHGNHSGSPDKHAHGYGSSSCRHRGGECSVYPSNSNSRGALPGYYGGHQAYGDSYYSNDSGRGGQPPQRQRMNGAWVCCQCHAHNKSGSRCSSCGKHSRCSYCKRL